MIPTAFVAVASTPVTISGKVEVDRRKLREVVATLTQEQIAAYTRLAKEKETDAIQRNRGHLIINALTDSRSLKQ